ncbi:MAG: galactokinase [Saprospiraceae bacterium]|nr:galactokinase [Saprospiraceae bacterium]MBK6564514.1 galactokinase [Saprospiraceae bacterium]MBK8079248.1 galactokinase [Saprospiraceae bacterium]MBK8371855.1 galactokinase [Saprospiraceae bacterium]MBK8547121.1 galactokinase [Saprospiraceae bacterium]
MLSNKEDVIEECKRRYGMPELVVFSPGRANIIGEHTDYSGGYVLPFATSAGLYFAAKKRKDLLFEITSMDTRESEIFEIDSSGIPKTTGFTRYIRQALLQLQVSEIPFGISLLVKGDLPLGAGMSSSSALTCGFLALCNEFYNLRLNKKELVELAVKAEHGTGVIGGKMDQYTIFFGEENKALLLDCQTMTHDNIDVNVEPFGFFLINTKVKHDLIDSPYNTRRNQSELALQKIQNFENNHSLLYKDLASATKYKKVLDDTLFKRAQHIISENQRVLNMVKSLQTADINTCGKILNDSHYSLRHYYEVSCPELDFLTDICSEFDDWKGGRMMGGGFGGCTINIFLKKNIYLHFEKIASSYFKKFGLVPELYSISPSGCLYTESLDS